MVLVLCCVFEQVAATDSELRRRTVAGHLASNLSQSHIIEMGSDEEDDEKKKTRLELLACQENPQCVTQLYRQCTSSGLEVTPLGSSWSPELTLSVNHGIAHIYAPDSVEQAKKLRQLQRAEELKLHYEDERNKFPPLDPEGMSDFPGVPEQLKLPKDYWLGLFLFYVDRDTAYTLRQCCKSLYITLQKHKATHGYFYKLALTRTGPRPVALYQSPSIFDHWNNITLEEVVPQLKALQWFKEQHPHMDLESRFEFLEDYEWCPRVFFDLGYWRMKRAYVAKKPGRFRGHDDDYECCPRVSQDPFVIKSHRLERSSSGCSNLDPESWSRKIILATHGADSIGNIGYHCSKIFINSCVFSINFIFFANRPAVVPQICQQIYSFPAGSFTPSMYALDQSFSWTLGYRNLTLLLPFMALFLKDTYMMITERNFKLGDKHKILDLTNRWPLWKREALPLSLQKDEFAILAFTTSMCIFLHPLLISWAIPLAAPFKESPINVGNFTQLLMTNGTNPSWMKTCCMMVGSYVQPGCYAPWALDAAKEVGTYNVREVAYQGLARVMASLPLIIVNITWLYYYLLMR